MILDVPDGKEPISWVWGELVPGIGPAAARFSQAVYTHTTLGLREFEAARLRVAQINGCLFLPGLAHRAGRPEGAGRLRGRRHRVGHHRRVRRPHPPGR
jgi:hypothetical protein